MIIVGGDGKNTLRVQSVQTPSLVVTKLTPFLAVQAPTRRGGSKLTSMVVQAPT